MYVIAEKPQLTTIVYDSVEDFLNKQLEYDEEYEEYPEILGRLVFEEVMEMAKGCKGWEIAPYDDYHYIFDVTVIND